MLPQITPDVNRFYWKLQESLKGKNADILKCFGLYRILLNSHLVEAGGVEPPSENIPLKPLHT